MNSRSDYAIQLNAPNIDKVARKLNGMREQATNVVKRAINRSVDEMGTYTVRQVAKKYLVKQKTYKDILIKRYAIPGELTGEVFPKYRLISPHPSYKYGQYGKKPFPLFFGANFKATPATPTPKNPPSFYKFKVGRSEGFVKLDEDAKFSKPFVADLPSRGLDFYRRIKGKKVTSKRDGRKYDALISYRHTNTIKMFKESLNYNVAYVHAANIFRKRLNHEIERIMEGIK